jgi:hypothetical protein
MMGLAASVVAPAAAEEDPGSLSLLKPPMPTQAMRNRVVNMDTRHKQRTVARDASPPHRSDRNRNHAHLHLSFFYKMDAQVGYWHS